MKLTNFFLLKAKLSKVYNATFYTIKSKTNPNALQTFEGYSTWLIVSTTHNYATPRNKYNKHTYKYCIYTINIPV